MPTLYVLQGPDKGRTLAAFDDVLIIGRGSEQLPLADQTVSRKHAELRPENGGWVVRDLNSANGTYLNGVRLQKPTRLKHGDQIRLGSTLVVYTGDDTIEQMSGANIPRDMVRVDPGEGALDAAVVTSVPPSPLEVPSASPETLYAVRSWNAMRAVTDVIGSLVSAEQLLPRVMDILFEEVDVERGVIFLQDEETREFLPAVVRFRSRKARAEAGRTAIVASRTIMKHVIDSHQGVISSNVNADERFQAGRSVHDLGMSSVLCAPIIARERVIGVIHLDCPVTRHSYNEHELRLVIAIGHQTGLALENARLVQAQLERERLAAAGETVAYLSHSIKNILQGMRSGADVVEKGLDKDDLPLLKQGWRILDRNLDKCYSLMLNMLAFSKQRDPHLEMLQINRIVSDVVELEQSHADDARIMLLADPDETVPPLPLDYDGMHQVLLNLVSNAIDAVPRDSGVIRVATRFDPVDRHAIVTVADNGPGVPEDERERIFRPFHSTKGHGGTGLGLAVARKIVTELGGTITVGESAEGGAEFRITLPTADARRPAPGETQGPSR